MTAPTANLPALLEALPSEDADAATRKPQLEFTREVRLVFLEALSIVGSVRSAARQARVSHQTVYRARRACAAFRRCWDAALVQALPQAEEELACRAIDGVEEDVLYHGEVVATRRRKDPRLLLAHLGRLDRLAARADVAALAEEFDAALEAFGEGRDLPGQPREPQGEAEVGAGSTDADGSSPEQCNTRSMSRPRTPDSAGEDVPATGSASARGEPACDCPGARHGGDRGAAHYALTARGYAPVCNAGRDTGPCCAEPRWPDCRDCPHYPPVDRMLATMEEARPSGAKPPAELGRTPEEIGRIEALQQEAFAAGVPRWWLVTTEAGLRAARGLAPGEGNGDGDGERDAEGAAEFGEEDDGFEDGWDEEDWEEEEAGGERGGEREGEGACAAPEAGEEEQDEPEAEEEAELDPAFTARVRAAAEAVTAAGERDSGPRIRAL